MKLYFVKHQFKRGTLSLTNLILFIVEYCYIKATSFIGEGHPSPLYSLYSEKHKTVLSVAYPEILRGGCLAKNKIFFELFFND